MPVSAASLGGRKEDSSGGSSTPRLRFLVRLRSIVAAYNSPAPIATTSNTATPIKILGSRRRLLGAGASSSGPDSRIKVWVIGFLCRGRAPAVYAAGLFRPGIRDRSLPAFAAQLQPGRHR